MADIELDFHNRVELRGNKIATLHIYDTQREPLGRLIIGRGGITYCKPGQWIRTGIKKTLEEVIESFS